LDLSREELLSSVASSSHVGRLFRFDGGEGMFTTPDDGNEVAEGTEFVALCDQTQAGYIKFNGAGNPPDRVCGLIYDGFRVPARQTLGDQDPSQWAAGLDGQPQDPWVLEFSLVLQLAGTHELYTFQTRNTTGRKAVAHLLQHYDRMVRMGSTELPVVSIRKGGYHDKRRGNVWVPTPVFAVVGRAPRDSVAKPDTTPSGDLNDEIGF
jgi:hypothetical protein